MNIELLRADVNSLKVDAIINPASASKPVAEFGSVPVGHAVVTSGGNVLCKFVIHAIVPRVGDRLVLPWLDRLAALRPQALYLNGDLFHYLVADPNFYTSSVQKVFARFRDLRHSGIAIHYVARNRHFFLHGSFVEDGVTDIA